MEIHPGHKADLIRLLRSCSRYIDKNYGKKAFPVWLKDYALKIDFYQSFPDRSLVSRLAFDLMAESAFIESRSIRRMLVRRRSKLINEIRDVLESLNNDEISIARRKRGEME